VEHACVLPLVLRVRGERRRAAGAYREAHLKLAREWLDLGKIVMGGAYADPVDGAALPSQVKDRATVEEFVKRDPYVANGLVTAWADPTLDGRPRRCARGETLD
jgi:uncharacterized protein YciI